MQSESKGQNGVAANVSAPAQQTSPVVQRPSIVVGPLHPSFPYAPRLRQPTLTVQQPVMPPASSDLKVRKPSCLRQCRSNLLCRTPAVQNNSSASTRCCCWGKRVLERAPLSTCCT